MENKRPSVLISLEQINRRVKESGLKAAYLPSIFQSVSPCLTRHIFVFFIPGIIDSVTAKL